MIGFVDTLAFMHAVARQGHDMAQLARQRHQPVGMGIMSGDIMPQMGGDQSRFRQAMRLGQIAGAQLAARRARIWAASSWDKRSIVSPERSGVGARMAKG